MRAHPPCPLPHDQLLLRWCLEFADPQLPACAPAGTAPRSGTPAGYYFRPGSGDGAKKWYIHMEGGGWCQLETPYQNWPNDNCLDRANNSNPTAWLARLGTLTADPPSAVWDIAYSSADPAVNPLMHSWNSVYLRYCDGGTFTGDNTTTVNGTKLHFKGRAIREASVRSLARRFGTDFSNGTDFVIGGSSAGGLAVYLHADWWHRQLPATATVAGLADSGFFLDWRSVITPGSFTHSYDADLRSGFALFNSSAGVNDACIAAHRHSQSDCIFAANTLPHIATPIFVLQSAFDSWQLQWEHGLAKNPDCKYYAKYSNHLLLLAMHGSFLMDCVIADAKLNAYGDTLTTQLKAASAGKSTVGGFVEHCFHHCTTQTLWTHAPRLGPEQLVAADAFTRWYEAIASGARGAGVGILWQSGALPCRHCGCPNATLCPDFPSCTGTQV